MTFCFINLSTTRLKNTRSPRDHFPSSSIQTPRGFEHIFKTSAAVICRMCRKTGQQHQMEHLMKAEKNKKVTIHANQNSQLIFYFKLYR